LGAVALRDLAQGSGPQHWIDDYAVSLWTNNGSIFSADERGYN